MLRGIGSFHMKSTSISLYVIISILQSAIENISLQLKKNLHWQGSKPSPSFSHARTLTTELWSQRNNRGKKRFYFGHHLVYLSEVKFSLRVTILSIETPSTQVHVFSSLQQYENKLTTYSGSTVYVDDEYRFENFVQPLFHPKNRSCIRNV